VASEGLLAMSAGGQKNVGNVEWDFHSTPGREKELENKSRWQERVLGGGKNKTRDRKAGEYAQEKHRWQCGSVRKAYNGKQVATSERGGRCVEQSNTVQKMVEVTRVCTCSENCALCIKCFCGIRDVNCEKRTRVYEVHWNLTACRLLNICQSGDYRGATQTWTIVRYLSFLKQYNGILWTTCKNMVTGIQEICRYNEFEQ
jgi:hypothetical protein